MSEEKVVKTDVRFQVKQETTKLNWAFRLNQKNVENFKMEQKKLFKKSDVRRIGRGEKAPDVPMRVKIEFVVPASEMKKARLKHEKFVKSQQV